MSRTMSATERTLPTSDDAKVELAAMHHLLTEQFVRYGVETHELEQRNGYYRQTTFTIGSYLNLDRLQMILGIAGQGDPGWNVDYSPAPGFTVTFTWDPCQDAE